MFLYYWKCENRQIEKCLQDQNLPETPPRPILARFLFVRSCVLRIFHFQGYSPNWFILLYIRRLVRINKNPKVNEVESHKTLWNPVNLAKVCEFRRIFQSPRNIRRFYVIEEFLDSWELEWQIFCASKTRSRIPANLPEIVSHRYPLWNFYKWETPRLAFVYLSTVTHFLAEFTFCKILLLVLLLTLMYFSSMIYADKSRTLSRSHLCFLTKVL